jgi:serine/threonine protein kinase
MSDPERYQILRQLGNPAGSTFAARDKSSSAPRFVVVERALRSAVPPPARAELLRRARALVTLEHPKVVRVREAYEHDGDVVVVSDFVDGEWLASFLTMQPRPPLGVMIRLVLDLLEGLGALHDLRDERGHPLRFVHGAISPESILVAEDGVAKIAHAVRLPRAPTSERYVAPELRRGEGPADARSDIYSAGAILRDLVADCPADASWAEPLTDIAWRACSVEPDNRWPSAAAMATTARRIAGSNVASAEAVSDLVRRRFTNQMLARRNALELGEEPPSSEPVSIKPSEMEVVESPSLVQTLPPPAVQQAAPPATEASPPKEVGRISLVKKPAALVIDEAPDSSEPQTMRRVIGSLGAPSASRAPDPPPPTPSPPERVEAAQLPPPTINPVEETPLDSYRRKMPTFPTFEQDDPPRRRTAMQGVLVAGAMVATFTVGWWLGRKYAPENEAVHPVRPPATSAVVATVPASPSAATMVAGSTPSAAGGRIGLGLDVGIGHCVGIATGVLARAGARPHQRDDAEALVLPGSDHAGRDAHQPSGRRPTVRLATHADCLRDDDGRAQADEHQLRPERALSRVVEPANVGMVEPRSLPACEHARRSHDGRLEVPTRQLAGEHRANLRVPHAPQGARLAVTAREQGLHLLDPSSRQPTARARPDALCQRRRVARDGDEPRRVPRPREPVLPLPRAHRPPRDLEHFQRAAHAREIVRVQPVCALAVHGAQALVQRGPPFLLSDEPVPLADLGAPRRSLGQPEEQRLHPEERPSAHNRDAPPRANVRDRTRSQQGPRRCVDVLPRVEVAHQVMGSARQLLRARLARADVEPAVDLHAVGAHHLAVEAFCQRHGERGLSARGRPDDRQQLAFALARQLQRLLNDRHAAPVRRSRSS